jgi:hypothetical protein
MGIARNTMEEAQICVPFFLSLLSSHLKWDKQVEGLATPHISMIMGKYTSVDRNGQLSEYYMEDVDICRHDSLARPICTLRRLA